METKIKKLVELGMTREKAIEFINGVKNETKEIKPL